MLYRETICGLCGPCGATRRNSDTSTVSYQRRRSSARSAFGSSMTSSSSSPVLNCFRRQRYANRSQDDQRSRLQQEDSAGTKRTVLKRFGILRLNRKPNGQYYRRPTASAGGLTTVGTAADVDHVTGEVQPEARQFGRDTADQTRSSNECAATLSPASAEAAGRHVEFSGHRNGGWSHDHRRSLSNCSF